MDQHSVLPKRADTIFIIQLPAKMQVKTVIERNIFIEIYMITTIQTYMYLNHNVRENHNNAIGTSLE